MRVLVLGSGPNGLVAARALQRAGHQVLILEEREQAGGLAAAGTVTDGVMHGGILHDSHLVRPWVLSELGIKLPRRAETDVYSTRGDVLRRPRQLVELVRKLRPVVHGILDSAPLELGEGAPLWPLARQALQLRRLGRETMMETLRIGAMPIDDLASELWDDPGQRALSMVPGLFGTWMGPRSPTTVATWLLHEVLRGQEVVGGPAALAAALLDGAPETRLGTRVSSIEVSAGAVTGVTLEDGETLPADAVISTLGPRRTLLGLVSPRQLDPTVAREISCVRVRGIQAKVHLVTAEPLFAQERVRVGAHPDELERAFDDARHRRLPRNPPLDVRQVGNVTSIWVYGASIGLRGGWTEDARSALLASVIARLEPEVGSLSGRVLASQVMTPKDLEDQYGLEGGHVLHGELGLDQLWVMRPSPRVARGRLGIAGLFLGSDGMHPGVPLSLTPGMLAAKSAASWAATR